MHLILIVFGPFLQDLSPCSFFLNLYSANGNDIIMDSGSKSWLSQLGKYALAIAERHKSGDVISSSQEVMSSGKVLGLNLRVSSHDHFANMIISSCCLMHVEIPMLLGALAGSLVVHESLGSYAIEILAFLNNMDPTLGVPLLLAVLYYCNFVRCYSKCSNDLLVSVMLYFSWFGEKLRISFSSFSNSCNEFQIKIFFFINLWMMEKR